MIKGELPKDFKVAVWGPSIFSNTDLIAEKVEFYLSKKKDTENVILVVPLDTTQFCYSMNDVAIKTGFTLLEKPVRWDKYNKGAGYRCLSGMLAEVDALIVFDNNRDNLCKYSIEEAKKKDVECKVVDISNFTCPECGGMLVQRTGIYGRFMGCDNYPSCHYKRNTL